tara:strand:- start:2525 stop:8788 length:6264 start_codon:yes stop_codon:yes gene_type:complete
MAEKRFIKGLFKDTAAIDQPAGSWRYANNMVLNQTDGAVSNEGGNELSGHLGDITLDPIYTRVGDFKAKVVGKIEVDDDKVVLFIVDEKEQNTNNSTTHASEIGIWENGVYRTLYKPLVPVNVTMLYTTYAGVQTNTILDFNTHYPIEGTFKINAKEDLIVYFTDDYNPPRAFNVSRQQRWIDSVGLTNPTSREWLYGIDPLSSHDDHINLLNLFPHSGPVPHILIHDVYWVNRPYQKSVNTGGGLLTGVYYLALAYIDDDFVSTNYLSVSNPVSIVEEYDHTRPRHKKDGAKHGTQTTKAIKWRVDNLNTDYKYISPVIIRKMGDATEAFKLSVVEITPDQYGRVEVVFSGLEGFTPSSVEDVIIDTISYEKAKTINQLDGVLYLGNLEGKKDLGYQKYANAIELSSEVKEFKNFDTFYATIDNLTSGFGSSEVDVFGDPASFQDVDASQSYRYVPNMTRWKGYQRDEVYAFYIAFVLKDGSMSYAYHIPGRKAISSQLRIDAKSGSSTYTGYDIKENSFLTSTGGTTTLLLGGSDDLGNPPPGGAAASPIYKDLQLLSPSYAKNFHFFDFSTLSGTNNMNYWENATETYPNTDEYQVWDEYTYIDNTGTVLNLADDFRGHRVRHHHFPDNSNSDRSVFNRIQNPNSANQYQSGYQCETASTVGPVEPRPWNVCFKAYIRLAEGPTCTTTTSHPSTYTANATACPENPPVTLTADHTTYNAYATAAQWSIGALGTNAYSPGSAKDNDGRCDVVPFQDKYPFGDETIIDQHNPTLPGITNPGLHNIGNQSVVTAEQKEAHETLWVGSYFKADQHMTVRVTPNFNTAHENNGSLTSTNHQRIYLKRRKMDGSYTTHAFSNANLAYNSGAKPYPCCLLPISAAKDDVFDFLYNYGRPKITLTLEPGERVYVMFTAAGPLTPYGTTSVSYYNRHFRIPYSSKCEWADPSNAAYTGKWNSHAMKFQGEVMFEVESDKGPVDEEMLHDVKIEHNVNALGFTLDNLKIPKSIADQVQGFRIYHAKRGHSNKTILGQAPSIPMRPDSAIIGICSEAAGIGSQSGQRIMQTESDTPQSILRKEPFATWTSYYPRYTNIYGGSHLGSFEHYGHKYFSFYDFHLLRTKNSLAGATHIKPQFNSKNFAWQGPTVQQPKKMISKIVEDTGAGNQYSPPLKRIEEEWGHDTYFNCYSEGVGTSLFIGCHYNPYQIRDTHGQSNNFKPFSLPRVLNQKSISYLRGDSIFRAEALGFGGTVVNEGGDSAIIYGLKDSHERTAYENSISSSCHEWSFYGSYTPGNPFLLVGNPIDPITHGVTSSGAPKKCNRSNSTKIDNLHAFKTDVYKSIDDQELVFTGFEVLGQDINNFVFWDYPAINKLPIGISAPSLGDKLTFTYKNVSGNFNLDGGGVNPKYYQADYRIKTLQKHIQRDSNGNKIPEHHGRWHIFGGDTFICRYGFANGYTPRDSGANSKPRRSVHYYIVETPDNINLRHIESDKSLYFPGTSAKVMLEEFHENDFNHQDNIKYDSNFSAVNDIRPAFPLPVRESKQDIFSTRTHRSVTSDATSVIDNYRIFKANQFKDLPKHRGDLWKLSTFNNLLYFHMEESLYAAKGKQQMQMKDGSEAFVGSGDIFQQDPDELIQTDGGYGGTQSQYAALTTRFGYFFVDAVSNKVFMMKDSLLEISAIGMETWFKENIPFALSKYGYGNCVTDNPLTGMGFHSVYDNKHKRIILTKREVTPTGTFILKNNLQHMMNTVGIVAPCTDYPQGYIKFFSEDCGYKRYGLLKNGSCGWTDLPLTCSGSFFNCAGWSISYYPELGVWGSFHNYVPYLYFNTSTDFYSFTDEYKSTARVWCTNAMVTAGVPNCSSVSTVSDFQGTTYGNAGIWKHNSNTKGLLYKENLLKLFSDNAFLNLGYQYPFEFEVIHNETKSIDSITASFNYTIDTFNSDNVNILENGFTKFYLYNTFQISANSQNLQTGAAEGSDLEYLVNIRRVGNNWKVNSFRDMASTAINSNSYYTSSNTNIIGGINTGTITTSSTNSMFNIEGMSETINPSYIDFNKDWTEQKKFMDKWVGIRLIYDNISNNLLNLYSTDVVTRKTYR